MIIFFSSFFVEQNELHKNWFLKISSETFILFVFRVFSVCVVHNSVSVPIFFLPLLLQLPLLLYRQTFLEQEHIER